MSYSVYCRTAEEKVFSCLHKKLNNRIFGSQRLYMTQRLCQTNYRSLFLSKGKEKKKLFSYQQQIVLKENNSKKIENKCQWFWKLSFGNFNSILCPRSQIDYFQLVLTDLLRLPKVPALDITLYSHTKSCKHAGLLLNHMQIHTRLLQDTLDSLFYFETHLCLLQWRGDKFIFIF